MKNIRIILLLSLFIFGSCKDKTRKETNFYLNQYTSYIDSIVKLPLKDASNNWWKIQSKYQNIKINLDLFNLNIIDKKRKDSFSSLFKNFRKEVMIETEKINLESAKILLAKSFFGNQYKNDRRTFKWVNSKNLVTVYNDFSKNVKENQNTYLKEDWDEIKVLFMALESRRKKIEIISNLSKEDKKTIQDIKLKFAAFISVD